MIKRMSLLITVGILMAAAFVGCGKTPPPESPKPALAPPAGGSAPVVVQNDKPIETTPPVFPTDTDLPRIEPSDSPDIDTSKEFDNWAREWPEAEAFGLVQPPGDWPPYVDGKIESARKGATAIADRKKLGAAGGGGDETEAAVLAGLRWLARHQSPDGGWDADSFKNQCKDTICEGAGFGEYDAGVTGLSMLAFLGAGYTHTSKAGFKWEDKDYDIGMCVKDGLRWLIKNQDADGCIGSRSFGKCKFMYNHCIVTLAMCEAYGRTGSGLFKDPAQKAVQFLLAAQNPGKAWRYQVQPGDNDTSVTGWAVLALKSAERAGLDVGKCSYDGAIAWLDSVTEENTCRVGYDLIRNRNIGDSPYRGDSPTAIGIICRMFIQKDREDARVKGGAGRLLQDLPAWDTSDWRDRKIDFYYWFWGSQALFQYDGPDGESWKNWNEAMKASLVSNQKTAKDKCAEGSWDTNDVCRWGFEGGRVYGTAINTLTLETYYLFPRVLDKAQGEKKDK